jgi:hypothetical protein
MAWYRDSFTFLLSKQRSSLSVKRTGRFWLYDGNAPKLLFLLYSNLRNGTQQDRLHVEEQD